MPTLNCPYCRTRFSENDAASVCPECGRVVAWLDHEHDFIVRGVDLWRVGRGQRQANVSFLVMGTIGMGIQVFHGALWIPSSIGFPIMGILFVLYLALANGFGSMLRGLGAHGSPRSVLTVLLAALMAFPVIRVPAIVAMNVLARRSFRRVGLPWRLTGWSERALIRAFARNFCRQCGYDLAGNVSGRCPECGAETEAELLEPGPRFRESRSQ